MGNIIFLLVSILPFQTAQYWKCTNGKISFNSNAPLELINAKSDNLKAVIDPATGKFEFSVQNNTFKGFNSALQQEHFHESYM
jgi:hypothetical protein